MRIPSVNITMVTWNRINLTRLCLERLLSTKMADSIVHVVDNGSTDGTCAYLSRLSAANEKIKIYFLRKNYGVAVAANFGWSLVDSDYYIKIDNDVEIMDERWLDRLIDLIESNKEIGMLGYRLLQRHKIVPICLPSGDVLHESTGCGGGLVCIPRKTHQCCGFWNEDYGCYGYEDLDYTNRVKINGYRVGYHPDDSIVRHRGYEIDIDADNEKIKYDSVSDMTKGEKLYLLNKFLFEEKIRSSYVSRKYLPVRKNSDIYFRLNRDYLPVIKIQEQLMDKAAYTKNGDAVRIDLNSFQA